jgi:hypothetical protein
MSQLAPGENVFSIPYQSAREGKFDVINANSPIFLKQNKSWWYPYTNIVEARIYGKRYFSNEEIRKRVIFDKMKYVI